jgi:hypothetical protein
LGHLPDFLDFSVMHRASIITRTAVRGIRFSSTTQYQHILKKIQGMKAKRVESEGGNKPSAGANKKAKHVKF